MEEGGQVRRILLTPTEWRVLEYLARHPNTVCSRAALAQHALGHATMGDALRWHMANLKRKLGPGVIETRRLFGWMFRPG